MKKIIAGFMTALMALLTVSTPVLAANTVADFPGMLAGSDGALNAYVVVGSLAAPSDVAGAIDIAVRLPEVGSDEVSTSCSSSTSVEGTRKDNVGLADALSTAFPASGILKTAHYSGLKDSKITWSGSSSTEYDYREQVDISGVTMAHDLATSNVNGTEKMVVETGDIKYQYVFDKAITHGGTVSVPNYTYPINIKLLGEDFSIVGTSSSQVLMLHGSVGTATATKGVTYGDYTVYSIIGVNSGWVTLSIRDADGNEVEQLTIDQGKSATSTTAGINVQVTTVRATQDNAAYADIVVGPSTEGTTKIYDSTADVTSSGTTSDRFPGKTVWGIQVKSGTFATSGVISVGDTLEVIYKPTQTQYLVAGEKVVLPNDYAELAFEGWNTDKFATVTIEALGSTISAYDQVDDSIAYGNRGGIKISVDEIGSNSIVSLGGNAFSEAYVLFNATNSSHGYTEIGFKDSTKNKILINGTYVERIDTLESTSEYESHLINFGNVSEAFTYPFKLNVGNSGDQDYWLNVTINGSQLIDIMTIGKKGSAPTISIDFNNKTAITTTSTPNFRLGATASSAEVGEVNATTESTVRDAGKKTQEIVDDSGIILLNTDSNGNSDKVVFKVPAKDLKAVVYFGLQSGTQTTTSGDTYTDYPSIPVTSTIAKLDSEMSSLKTAKHLILVGGPCVNTLVAELADDGKFSYTCDAWPGRNFGIIEVIDDGFATGKVVLVVAGTRAEDTRVAASAVQQYDTKLTSKTGTSVEVTGTVGSPVVG